MNYISLTPETLDREHICCCLSDADQEGTVNLKKAWMKERFADGLVFRRLDARAKVFIEYIPASKAWYPVDADEYMWINCLWVSGSHKGKGHGKALLQYCLDDARSRGFKGAATMSSKTPRQPSQPTRFSTTVC